MYIVPKQTQMGFTWLFNIQKRQQCIVFEGLIIEKNFFVWKCV